MSTYRYQNTELYYNIYSGNIPILFIHGWRIDHHYLEGCMEPVLEKFPEKFERIYIDLPGMGQSVEGNVKNTDDILELLLSFIKDKLGSRPFLLMGNSYGGTICRAITLELKTQVMGMILLCPGTGCDHAILPDKKIFREDKEFLNKLSKSERECFCLMNVNLTKSAWQQYERDVYPAILHNQNNYFLNHVLCGSMSKNLVKDNDQTIFNNPVLIITGKQDSMVGFEEQFRWIKQYPAATYLALEGAGHNLCIDQPALFSEIIANFLKNFLI